MKTKARISTALALVLTIAAATLAPSPVEASVTAPDGRKWELQVTCDPYLHEIHTWLWGTTSANAPTVYLEVWSVSASGRPYELLGQVRSGGPAIATRVSLRGAYLLKAVYAWIPNTWPLTIQTRAEWVPRYSKLNFAGAYSYCYL